MIRQSRSVITVISAILFALGLLTVAVPKTWASSAGYVVVANRASGSISIIDVATDTAFDIPLTGVNTPEPMYVVSSPASGRLFVGDRANNQVVVFRTRDFSVEDTVPAGNGVFHMWASPSARQLWVNNDIDNTVTVIDTISLGVVATIPLPADLVSLGGKPHDVIVAPNAPFAYVSMLGFSGDNDYVIQYHTKSFMELNRAAVGKDPHLSLARQNRRLYVPCQNSDSVYILDRTTLEELDVLMVPGAHGAGMSVNGKIFYTTNLPGGGIDGLFTIGTKLDSLIGEPADTPFTVPHNIALTPDGKKIYVTHSGGPNDVVSVYTATRLDPVPKYLTSITVGNNPFGLDYVP